MRSSFLLLRSLFCSILLVIASAAAASSFPSSRHGGKTLASDTTNNNKDNWKSKVLERSSKHQDAYVSASPLSVAAVCSDGIALISLHFGLELSSDDGSQREGFNERGVDGTLFHDLPISSRGPLRIEPIHDNGATTANSMMTSSCSFRSPPAMALITAGWRTDGMALADAARELMMEETSLYCLPLSVTMGTTSSDEGHAATANDQQSYYGRRIADGLSYYMTKCAFSEGVRSLSTIGLLACNSPGRGSCLYLVDATGSYRVRAHAIGNGASTIHKRLVSVNFEDISCVDGLRTLLQIVAEEAGLSLSVKPEPIKNVSPSTMDEDDGTGMWSIPRNPAVELAVLSEQRMRRFRLSSLDTEKVIE